MSTLVEAPGVAHRTLVVGVLNATPDSFFEGSRVDSPTAALALARGMLDAGADIVDVGAESSRPGADPIGETEELRRLLPVLDALRSLSIRVSVDTYRASTAREALRHGVSMINDISALRNDPDMAGVIAGTGVECVLMHMKGMPKDMQHAPHYGDVVDEICSFFEERIRFALSAGIREDKIWLDPGFGFGKSVGHNLQLLNRLAEFKRFGRPVLVGTSNKSSIGTILNAAVDDRAEGTAATVAIAIMNGADAVRVHDVKAMARVARMCDAVLGRIHYD